MSRDLKHTELNARKWDSRAEKYDDRSSDYMRHVQERTIALMPLRENLCFLDIGCGTGWAVRHVARRLNERGEFCGIDISPKMLEKAEDNARKLKSVHFYEGSAEDLPFPENLFDIILCTNSFHHYLHPAAALNEIQRTLKPSGRVYIADVTTDELLAKSINWILEKREPEHVSFHSTLAYRRLLADAQLEHIASKTIMFPFKVHIGEKRLQA